MPTVNVQLYGSTDTGFAIIINPWCAVVSQTGDKEIQWISDRQVKIVYDEPGHFPNHAASPNGQPKAKSGPLDSAAQLGTYHYTIQIKNDKGVWITVDPDYRIER